MWDNPTPSWQNREGLAPQSGQKLLNEGHSTHRTVIVIIILEISWIKNHWFWSFEKEDWWWYGENGGVEIVGLGKINWYEERWENRKGKTKKTSPRFLSLSISPHRCCRERHRSPKCFFFFFNNSFLNFF